MKHTQRGNFELTSDLFSWLVGIVMTFGGGLLGGATVYFGLKQDIAVINVKLEYIKEQVDLTHQELKNKADKP